MVVVGEASIKLDVDFTLVGRDATAIMTWVTTSRDQVVLCSRAVSALAQRGEGVAQPLAHTAQTPCKAFEALRRSGMERTCLGQRC